jgi:hypothetical protein
MNNSIENLTPNVSEIKELEQDEKECIENLSLGNPSLEIKDKLSRLSEEFRQSDELKNAIKLGFRRLLSHREPQLAYTFMKQYDLPDDFVIEAAKGNYDFLMSSPLGGEANKVFAEHVKKIFNL